MKIKIRNFIILYSTIGLILGSSACNKSVEVPEPANTLTTTETFAKDGTANSAVAAIYSDMLNAGNSGYANSLTNLFSGLSADELLYFQSDPDINAFQSNSLISANSDVLAIWQKAYFDIYMANGVIEGLNASKTISAAMKTQLLGEAKFLRAYVYFYMVNCFGNVPLVTTTDYATSQKSPNSTPALVYQQIIADLTDAQNTLVSDYSYSSGQRIRANKWAATALLARVYLYYAAVKGDASYYGKAADQASQVIANSGIYSLVSDLNSVFLANSNEAIWQLEPDANSNYATMEGYSLLPSPLNSGYPKYYLTDQLLSSFESGDQRKIAWIDSTNYSGTNYYFPYKYKANSDVTSSNNIPEYYMMLRLAEQYLILAEAQAQQNELPEAIGNLNIIRNRAGLSNLSPTLGQSAVLAAVMQERKIELFAEWGHRWFDLKRTRQAGTVLTADKALPVSDAALLWPIPYSETQSDPFLKQNPGY